MSKFKFNKEDVYVNRTKTYPDYKIFVNDANVTINNDVVTNVSSAAAAGYQSLYEYNFDTRFGYIHPFVTYGENNVKQIFRSQTTSSNFVVTSSQGPNQVIHAQLTQNTNNIASSYLSMTASLQRVTTVSSSYYRYALANLARNYYLYSPKFANVTTASTDDNVNLINIPQVMFGSSVKKGSVELNFYVTGTLIARATDAAQNGELKQTSDGITNTGIGEVVGLVFYNEGLIYLTSSAALYTSASLNSWLDFGTGLHDDLSPAGLEERSFEIKYKGTNYVNTITMFCHAKAGELNLSNNPTSIDWSEETTFALSDTGSTSGFEERQKKVKNVVSSSFENLNDDFKKTTYISKINMYDDKGNLIGIASLAQPIRKEENNDYTFKIELDT